MRDSEEEVSKFRPVWVREPGNQLGLALQCESASEVDQLYDRMISAGYQEDKEPWDAFWGQRYAQLRDLDGVRRPLRHPLKNLELCAAWRPSGSALAGRSAFRQPRGPG